MSSGVEVTVSYPMLAFFYGLLTPSVHIDGQARPVPWGTHFFELAPGDHEVGASYPWLFSAECGKATARVTVSPGETRKVTYCAHFIRYLPGKLTVA